MTRKTKVATYMLHLFCLAVLLLSGCSGGTQDQAGSVPNQPGPGPNQPGPGPNPPGPEPNPPGPGPNPPGPVSPTATLFAGNPRYEGESVFARAEEGHGLLDLDKPPLQWQSLLFAGNKLVTHVPAEIWYTDLTVGKPVIKRLAGRENLVGPQSTSPGLCSDARFADIKGIALKTDGSIVGAAQSGSTPPSTNTIFVVTDPFDPVKCTVTHVASSVSESVAWPAVINDTIYFIDNIDSDNGINMIKRLEYTAFTSTVSTIATLPEGFYRAMVALNGKLYTVAKSFLSEGFILEIDPATGLWSEIIRGGAETFGNSSTIDIAGLATDGTGLFAYNGGHPLYVTLQDHKVKSVAGDGTFFDFKLSYDPTQPHTAESVQLVASSRAGQLRDAKVFLAFHENAVYFSALADGEYIERIAIK